MPVTREYRSLTDIRAALAGRLDRARVSSLFDRIDWYEDLARVCFADSPVRVFQAVEGECEAWLFLRTGRGRHMSALSNWYSFSWAPVFLGSPDAAERQRLLGAVARAALKEWAQIDLHPVMNDPAPLLSAFRAAGWFAVRRKVGGRYVLRIDGRTFDQYWAGRPGPLRTLVRRKGRGSPFT